MREKEGREKVKSEASRKIYVAKTSFKMSHCDWLGSDPNGHEAPAKVRKSKKGIVGVKAKVKVKVKDAHVDKKYYLYDTRALLFLMILYISIVILSCTLSTFHAKNTYITTVIKNISGSQLLSLSS